MSSGFDSYNACIPPGESAQVNRGEECSDVGRFAHAMHARVIRETGRSLNEIILLIIDTSRPNTPHWLLVLWFAVCLEFVEQIQGYFPGDNVTKRDTRAHEGSL